MSDKKIYHLNDKTLKYAAMVQSERLHQYLGLPGEYEAMYPQEITFPNMDTGRIDDYHTTKEGLLIDVEEESKDVTEKTLKKFGKYVIFGEFMYSRKLYIAVICHKDPTNYPEYYERSPSVYIKMHYYYFPQDELWEKYEKVINKVEQKEQLTKIEALDIAFVPKFISKDSAPFVTETLSKAFEDAIINDKILKMDVGVLLGAMIIKNVDKRKQEKLLEDIGMKQIENRIKRLAADEVREAERKNLKLEQDYKQVKEELNQFKEENHQLKENNSKFKEELEKLNNLPNLTPEVKSVINSLIILG